MKAPAEFICRVCGAGFPAGTANCPSCGRKLDLDAQKKQPASGGNDVPLSVAFCYIIGGLVLLGGAVTLGDSMTTGKGGSEFMLGLGIIASSVLWFAIARGIILLNRIAHHTAATHEILRRESER